MSSSNTGYTKRDSPVPDITPDNAIEHAKRAFALKKYEQAVDYYATALEHLSRTLGEDSPEIADLYFAYGKSLLENAISQTSVLGKDQPEEEGAEDDKGSSSNGPILSFSGDAEEDAAAGEEDDNDDEDAEPEDDFNAAWEVLDLARAIYDKQHDADTSNEDVALKLADCYIALGDVSLETEKFDQGITDYEVGLTLKSKLLPLSSRQIAEAHYKLSIVLDLTPGRLSDSIKHADQALRSIESRLGELKLAKEHPSSLVKDVKPDPKGKGKGKALAVAGINSDAVQNMSATQIEGELKELAELKEELALRIEELKMAPNETLAGSAPALAAQALDKELASKSSPLVPAAVVNDLTNMVRKKKAPTTDGSSTKRKANDGEDSGSEKKLKLDAGAS
ncbi:shni tpr [Lentinula edodes]|uniref:Shni tpr n=1 Tax=Lentinula edodes TaxID=5353 RepID=A0A1Q3EFK8_LENED|nr:shni tpr [Lentinula edodes]